MSEIMFIGIIANVVTYSLAGILFVNHKGWLKESK